MSYARPLHVFDADKVKGTIHARLAHDGETIEALDGKTYTLDSEMTVIADESGPEGIAGIIGGEATGCGPETTNVFLEAAYFDPIRTATTGRKLGIISDARFRFERGVDPAFVEPGAEIATQMILELCGGEASELVIAGRAPLRGASVRFRLDRVKTLAGVDIPAEEQLRILDALGFAVAGAGGEVVADVPSWRPDINGEADLVEEVVRIYGLDKVAHVALPRLETVTGRHVTAAQRRRFIAARALAARGLNEAMTWSFLPKSAGGAFRRRRRDAGARQSDLVGAFRHAPLAPSQPHRRRRAQRRARLLPIWRSSRSGRSMAATGRRTSASTPRAFAAAWMPRATGRRRAAPSTFSTPRPTPRRCSPRSARRSTSCRPWPRARPGIIPAASARSCSGRRTGSRCSARCIRACLPRWMLPGRSSPSRSI